MNAFGFAQILNRFVLSYRLPATDAIPVVMPIAMPVTINR
jgi:hypothetical protein